MLLKIHSLELVSFLDLYLHDGMIQTVLEHLRSSQLLTLRLKGLKGSQDAVIAAALTKELNRPQLFIMNDKEEAAYFHNDLQSLLPSKEVWLFPTSYKKPYQFEEVENANILMRAEILNRMSTAAPEDILIVTYPEALVEMVINRRSLASHTLRLSKGDHWEIGQLNEQLQDYGFERTDFVYEAGQLSVRGGIVDIYSFANEWPFRLEFMGSELESIRTFDPISQLSRDELQQISIIPNIQTELTTELRESFFNFLPAQAAVWLKDRQQVSDLAQAFFIKAQEIYEETSASSGGTLVISKPEVLFETGASIKKNIERFKNVEFGNRFYGNVKHIINFEAEPQPSFQKNFDMMVAHFHQYQMQHYQCILLADSPAQRDRLRGIFEELDHELAFELLPITLRGGFVDHQLQLVCFTDHQLFERYHKYQVRTGYTKSKALTLKELSTLHPGDYVVHIEYGVGRFAGMEKVQVNDKEQEALRLVYRDDDLLYISVHSLHKISRYSGKEGATPLVSKLGSQEWEQKKKRAKSKVKEIARDLIELYAKRKAAPGFAFGPDGFMQAELESSFLYDDTPDQAKATDDVKSDMIAPHPMDRLVCGDVGFGKTEVAIRAAFKCVVHGKQVAVLVPTTILAMQHFRTFSERLANFPVSIEYINRFKSTQNIKATLKRVAEGQTNILIGTHRMVNRDVKFKDLGLLVIDEEQKFGVSVKEKLKEIKVNVDTLTLTATPIPRTLHFSLMGARDLSIMATPPPNRQPVTTEIHSFDESIIRDAISFEIRRGGQVFFVHNRVSNIEEVSNIIFRLVPDARIAIAHGQMVGAKLEKVMVDFIDGQYDVLISTNIIESGLDIPNANTIIINQAHMFGLSDLHQMRGRVGRSNRKAFCYLLTPPSIQLTSDARKRLSTLEEFSDLGGGIKVALRDLDIRGAGNLLGKEQSGFISDLGFEMYHKILDEAVSELKEAEFKELFAGELPQLEQLKAQDCSIETDLELLIPDQYVSSVSERLQLYSSLDNLANEGEITSFEKSLIDRFGAYPPEVTNLIETVRLRWQAQELGCEKLIIKNEQMKCYLFPSSHETYYQSEVFGIILAFVSKYPRMCQLKETKKRIMLIIQEIDSIGKALQILHKIGADNNETKAQ